MSDTATSGEAPVAPAETVSAPSAPAANTAQSAPTAVPASFGTSRGSGLARGKRASNPATTSNTAPAPVGYTPSAIQIVTTAREYKNPFAPETPAEPAPAPAASVSSQEEKPAAAVVAPEVTPAARPAPAAEVTAAPAPVPAPAETAPAASTEPAEKAELKILPPENKVRPAQSWESSSFPSGGQPSNNNAGTRSGERPIFRTERHRQRDAEAAQNAAASGSAEAPRTDEPRREFREPRQPRDPRDQRSGDRRDGRDNREPRAPRGFEKQPGTTPPIAPAAEEKKGGLMSWIKGLFSGSPAEAEKPAEQPGAGGERRFDRDGRGGGGRRHHRGGRGGQGNRGQGGGFRGENRSGGPRAEGQPGGEHRGQGGHGGDRNHHRGGRGGQRGGRGQGGGGFRGERRGGEGRPSDGGSSGPAAS